MYEVAWVRERGTRNAWGFLVFVVVPLLAGDGLSVGRETRGRSAAPGARPSWGDRV